MATRRFRTRSLRRPHSRNGAGQRTKPVAARYTATRRPDSAADDAVSRNPARGSATISPCEACSCTAKRAGSRDRPALSQRRDDRNWGGAAAHLPLARGRPRADGEQLSTSGSPCPCGRGTGTAKRRFQRRLAHNLRARSRVRLRAPRTAVFLSGSRPSAGHLQNSSPDTCRRSRNVRVLHLIVPRVTSAQ